MIAHTPFLKEVAHAYVANERDKLPGICFITPNKRSAVFLGKYFGEELISGNKPALLPEIITISDFIAGFSDTIEASRIEQLFILYNVYSEILTSEMTSEELSKGVNLIDFNRFQYWGDILLNDFNDVDKYLVDAAQLFKNIENLKELSANFLTPRQIEVIRKYWNENMVPEPVKAFWRHTVHTSDRYGSNNKKNVAGFIKLWQAMYRIYTGFRNRLKESHMSYSGMAYRDTVEILSSTDPEDLEFNRYVFVGFNVLSSSEKKMFTILKDKGCADFYWDYASPAFKVKGNSASKFLNSLVKEFPSIYDVGKRTVNDYPQIEVIAMPSAVGQVKIITPLLKGLYPDIFSGKDTEQTDLINTAIVFPDESLSIYALDSLPSEISNVNITMGFQLRHTPVASLIRNIVSLQLRARKSKFGNTFYYEDVLTVLSHPLVRRASEKVCSEIVKIINLNRLFNIPISLLTEDRFLPLRPIFEMVDNANDPDAVFGYIDRLTSWLLEILSVGNGTDETDDDGMAIIMSGAPVLETGFVKCYRDALAELRRLKEKYLDGDKIFLEDKTVFHLVERIVGNQSVAFEGMPLQGLQMMGVLETRNLDFENLFILSMNERIFPRKHYSKSFIPHALRSAYSMSTLEYQESIYAYYFYRLLTRVKKVYLLYDGRTTGIRSGDVSRYINQLRYMLPAGKVRFSSVNYPMVPIKSGHLVIPKSARIMEELDRFRSDTRPRNLSASSLNAYINCPLQFYLAHIERYYPEEEIKDYMDEGTYGTIIHEVLERIYTEAKGNAPELEITPGLLRQFRQPEYICKYLEPAIKSNYLKIDPYDPRPLKGDAEVFLKVMTRSLKIMFEREEELGKTFFLRGEIPINIKLKVSSGNSINLTYRIDRVDRAFTESGEPCIRLIDYKTGEDQLSTTSIDKMFDSSESNRPKAMFQLFLYSMAYAQKEEYSGPIQPYIYKFRTMATKGFVPLSFNRKRIDDYNILRDEFTAHLDALLDEIFDPSVPFNANPGEHTCKYCKFQELCRYVL